MLGIKLMHTANIREQVMTNLPDDIDAVSGRWTLLSKLKNPDDPST